MEDLQSLLKAQDPTTLAVAAAVFVAVSLLAVLLFGGKRNPSEPPVWGGGLPLISHFHRFSGSPVAVIKEGYQKNGPVFTMTFLNNKMTFLIGADAQTAFYRATDEELSQNEPYKFMTPIFGRGIVFDAPNALKAEQLRFVAGSLKATALKTYVPMIIKEVEEYLESWGDSGSIDLMDAMSRLIILTASRCLLGREIRENLFEEVAALLHDLDEGISPLAIFFPNAPIPAFRKRDAARREVAKLFGRVIANRRAAGESHPDMLQHFMDAEYKDGTRLTDDQITGLLLGVLFAGQHTSSISTTWTILSLLHYPAELKKAMNETVNVFGAEPTFKGFDYDNLGKLDHLHRCVKEVLRQYPPLIMLMRLVKKPLNVLNYTVPAGHLVFTSPAVSMNLPNDAPDAVFRNPEVFDPDRFNEERREDKKDGKTFAFSAFGGGMHGCLGEQFGYLQVKTIVSIILRRYELEPLGPLPVPNYRAMVVGPTQPTMVRFKRRTTPIKA